MGLERYDVKRREASSRATVMNEARSECPE